MPLLIDGHNVIGSGVLENISLQDENDEERFVQRLRVWRSNYRGDVTVVFDRGIVGGASRELSGGGVEVIFARDPQEADDLIKRRIQKRQQGLIDRGDERLGLAPGSETARRGDMADGRVCKPNAESKSAFQPFSAWFPARGQRSYK